MWRIHAARAASALGLVASLGFAAAPAVQAQGLDGGHASPPVYAQRDNGDRGGPPRVYAQDGRGPDRADWGNRDDRGRDRDDWGRDRDDQRPYGDHDRYQPPVVVAPPAYQPPTVVQPVPVPVMPEVTAYVLPPLEALFPAADFANYPPTLVPVGNNVYIVSSPQLFWTADQLAAAQALASELAQSSPGCGATVVSGPLGYGAYLTYQPYF